MHWRSVNENPNSPEVRRFLTTTLAERKRGRVDDLGKFLREFVSGLTVLDIGVVQHDLVHVDEPLWKHGRIKEWAKRCVGVDILESAVAELNRRGFDVRCVDATSDADLGERFDRVFLGDVLEHVDSPVALLRFARRHLLPGGLVLCTTPNPSFVSYIVEGLRRGSYIPNAEHVVWVTPSMALELARRSGLELKEYWHVQGEGKTRPRKLAVQLISMLGIRDSEPLAPSFCFVFASLP